MRRALVFVSVVAAFWGLVPGVSASAEVQSPEAIAFAEAVDTGVPVEIVAERTESETVFANPSGTVTREISSAPIRVKQGADWAPVDLTLVKTADGVVPKAAPGEVKFSRGGTDPLVEHTLGGVTTAVSWPTVLPEPVLDGPTATYPDVFAGVDLKMTVTDAGVSQVLVVQDAEAAAIPGLRELNMATDVDGGSLRAASGGFEILDGVGRVVGVSPAPSMWDSAGTVIDQDLKPVDDQSATAIDQRTSGPVEGDDISSIALAVSSDELTLAPQVTALTGADVKYPLYIDPSAGSSAFQWAMVFKENPNTTFYKWTDSNGQGVGHQNFNGVSTKRLFFQHSISALTNSQVITATFKARMVWSASCTTRPIRLYRSGEADSATTWNNQPSWGEYIGERSYSAGWSGCNPSGRDVVWDVKNVMQDAVNEDRSSIAFGMRAQDETDPLTWRRFLHTTSISVEYNRTPTAPSLLYVNGGTACPTTGSETIGRVTALPIVATTVRDVDGGTVRGLVQWSAGSTVVATNPEIVTAYVASGAAATATLPLPKNAEGTVVTGTWSFRIRAQDPLSSESAYSPECTFTTDATPPAGPVFAAIPDPWVAGTSYTIEFQPGGVASDTAGYRFSLDSDQPDDAATLKVAVAPSYTYSHTETLTRVGINTLWVWAYDQAGNRSAGVEYNVNVVAAP